VPYVPSGGGPSMEAEQEKGGHIMPKRYKVTGTQPVLDNRMPGEMFTATIAEGQEQFLIGIGALKIVDSNPTKPAKRTAKKKG
jgi:hypothetical protein